jgi:hypothetical protein
MKRLVALVAAVTVVALAPAFTTSAPTASADHIIDQGCVHFREIIGPWGARVVNAYMRCNYYSVYRKPIVENGTDGSCKRLDPDRLVQWNLWSANGPFHAVHRLAPC